MSDKTVYHRIEKSLDALAADQHDIWSHWMNYMFTCGVFMSDGTWVMPPSLVGRWQRQANTPYHELSDAERQSDRDVVSEFVVGDTQPDAREVRAIANSKGPADKEDSALFAKILREIVSKVESGENAPTWFVIRKELRDGIDLATGYATHEATGMRHVEFWLDTNPHKGSFSEDSTASAMINDALADILNLAAMSSLDRAAWYKNLGTRQRDKLNATCGLLMEVSQIADRVIKANRGGAEMLVEMSYERV